MIPQDWTPEDWERARQKHAKRRRDFGKAIKAQRIAARTLLNM